MVHGENEVKTSNVKITEALELLNEAAKEKRDELKELLTEKYSHIKQIFDKSRHAAQEAIVAGEEKIKMVVSEADRRVHKDPWPYIAGVAAVSLLVGYLVGSKRK